MATEKPKIPPSLPASLEERLKTPIPKAKKIALTPKEWTFVQELVGGDGQLTMREAAVKAGYSPKGAQEAARKLTNPAVSPHVVAAIQELRHDLAERYGTTMERHMRDLQNIRDLALQAGAFSAAVQAEYRRGQALGTIYIDRKEIRHGTIDSMSKEEVMRKLNEIRQMYGNPGQVIDITPTQIEESKETPEPELGLEEAKPGQEGPEDLDPKDAAAISPKRPQGPPDPFPPAPKMFLDAPPRIGRPPLPATRAIMEVHATGVRNFDRATRAQIVSDVEGEPVKLPYHPS